MGSPSEQSLFANHVQRTQEFLTSGFALL